MKYIQPLPPPSAEARVKRIHAQVRRDFGLLPEPVTLHAALPDLLAGAWMVLRETLLAGTLPRHLKETVAAAVSRANDCPYCVDAHTTMLHAAAAHDAARALHRDAIEALSDPEARAYARWARATRSPGDPALRRPPFSPEAAPEAIGTALCFHYINRLVTVFLDETPFPFRRAWLRSLLGRLGGLTLARAVQRPHPPGESLGFLPEARLPGDHAWAAGSPAIAGAFARFARATEAAGRTALPRAVRDAVRAVVNAWPGEAPGPGRGWLEAAVRPLPGADRAAGRLALLAALAPHQVDGGIIGAYREHHAGDAALLGAVAWASFTAARRIGTWLGPRGRTGPRP